MNTLFPGGIFYHRVIKHEQENTQDLPALDPFCGGRWGSIRLAQPGRNEAI